MFVRNCWYMAGWTADFQGDGIIPLTLLNERVIAYRASSGGLVAMEDRCCHRLAPLSLGAREGDDIRCMYHGLKFGPGGRCNEIPGQDHIPDSACVRTYPMAERHGAAWIWMGDAARADEALIPPFVGVEDPSWCMRPGRIDYDAGYFLVNDNLLDLSHIAYLHRNTFARDDVDARRLWTDATPTVIQLDRGVRVQRWLRNRLAPKMARRPGELIDEWQTYDFLVPGVFLMRMSFYARGTADRHGGRAPNEDPVHEAFTCQAVTPLSDRRTGHFFGFGPWPRHARFKNAYYRLALAAFNEDRVMIEAQQSVVDATPNPRMMTLHMDKAATMFRAVMEREMQAEGSSTGRPRVVASQRP